MTQSVFIGNGNSPNYDLVLTLEEGDVHHEEVRLKPNQNWQGYIWSGRTITIKEATNEDLSNET